jgi:multidrug efflux pump subunit AcrB
MIRNIVATFVKYPFYANLLIISLFLAGTFSLLNMKKSFFPERSTTTIIVNVFYPGASPKEMEEGVTVRVEESLRGLVGIKEITSSSSENFASITVETTGQYDIDETLAEVKNAVDGISSFPVDAEKPVVFKVRSVTQAGFLGLSGDVDRLTLKNVANDIENDLYASGIISQLNMTGLPPLEISIEVSEEDLLRFGLTFSQISNAIRNNNQDVSGGLIRNDNEEILIRSRYRTVDPDRIADIVVRANSDGTNVRIRDIASVKLQFSEDPMMSKQNGKPSVSFQVNKLGEEDLDEISDFLHDYVEEFNAKHDNVKLEFTYDFLTMLNGRLDLLLTNGGIGLFLVLVSLGFFLNIRLSFWVAIGIPASFAGMFVLAVMLGITINMISLFGMILVIGILVDDGIVIAENIYAHFEEGKTPMRAAVDGTMEVMPAIITSVTTTIVAFSPLLILSGRMEFMYEMAFVVIVSLGVSLFEAFFVLPAHLGTPKVLRRSTKKGQRIRKAFERFIDFLRYRIYGNVLRVIIRYKYVMIFAPVFLIMITIGLFSGGFIKYTFFPAIEFDQIQIELAYKPGSGEKRTMETLNMIEDKVWQVNAELMEEYNDTNTFVNYSFVGLGTAFNGTEIGAHAGNLFITMRDMEGSPISTSQIAKRMGEAIGEIPDAEKFSVGGRNRWGSPVSISILGKDLEELELAKIFLIERLREISELKDVTENNSVGKREVRLKLKPKAYLLGLSQAQIAGQVRQGFYGDQAQRLQVGRDEVRVWVRYPKTDRLNLSQLENMRIKTAVGDFPLKELAHYDIERGPVSIKHYNGAREIRIDADLTDFYAEVPPILDRISKTIIPKLQNQFRGVDVVYQGQQRDSSDAMGEMQIYFGTAFMLMILIIMIHFKSLTQGIIVILMIPLGWLGSAWGHGVEGHPISMLSAWGMVALSGVIINDAVVFLAKYNSFLLEGLRVKDAVYKAGLARFRAILLTTITTVAGLYPLILEQSFQAQFLIPMAISLAYGVLVGTTFILLFFPSLILVLNDFKRIYTGVRLYIFPKKKYIDGEYVEIPFKWPSPEDVEPAVRDSRRVIE